MNESKITIERKNLFVKMVFAFFVCLLACGLYYRFFVCNGFVEVELEVTQETHFKIYWAEAGQPYAEKNMSVVKANPERKKYSFFLTDIGKIARLRVDTHRYEGEATLKHLQLVQNGWAPLILSTPEDFSNLTPLSQIADYRVDSDGLWVESTGDDPNFEWIITPQYQGIDGNWLILRFFCISLIVCLVVRYAGPLAKELRFVPFFLFGVWGLIMVMACISNENEHPDEYVHMFATSYYQDNWLPPVLESDDIIDSYSVYGVSRLNNGEVYYLFAGKFQKFIEEFRVPEYLSFRMFNIFLFGLILLYTIGVKHARMVAIPFLVSPQIWYVFSYCNSDAFALFFTFVAACQLVNPESLLHRFLKGDGRSSTVFGAVALSILLGLVFLLKKNYYPFIALFYLCLGVKFFVTQDFFWDRKEALKRLVFITLAGLLIFGLRIGADYMVNGPDRQVKIETLKEELAHPWYKPSTALHDKHISLYRKARGTTLQELIVIDRWFEKTFLTSFGVFGYFTISGSQKYYDLVRWTGGAFLVFFLGSILLRGGYVGAGLAVSVFTLSAALIGVSLHHSWTADFQAQGRYLFPIVPMLGILYGLCHAAVNRQILIVGASSMYMFGIYIFIGEALLRIPKVVFP